MVSGHSEHTASTCELPGGHTSHGGRHAQGRPVQMMYLEEWVAKLSAAYLEEAERNGYACGTPTSYHELLGAFRSLQLDKRTEVKRTSRSSAPRGQVHTSTHRGLDSHESRCAAHVRRRTHAHQHGRERRGHMHACRKSCCPSCAAHGSCVAVMAKKELSLVSSTATRRRGRVTSSREAVGGGADLKANEV